MALDRANAALARCSLSAEETRCAYAKMSVDLHDAINWWASIMILRAMAAGAPPKPSDS
jgi:hypothetical protein